MDATMKETLITSQKQRPLSAESRVIITKQGEIIPEEVYFDHLDHHFTSENLDQYALKNVTTVGDLQRELAANANESSLYRNKPRVHSDKNETKQLIPKKIQVKPFVYDNKGNLIGSQEDYFTEVLSQNKGTNVLYNPKESLENQENILYNTNNTKETIDKSKALYNSKNEEEIHIPKQDYSGVKSKLLNTKTVKKARILDPYEEADKLARRKERIRKFGEQTKSLANSAFTTYYGKPAFENYGRGNIKPAAGGLIYGNYMKTHNVNPHRGNKNPHFKQTYNNALMYGSRMPACEPELPRKVKEDYRLSQVRIFI